MSTLPSCLRPALFERVAEGWTANAIAAWLAEQCGVAATASDVLDTLQQAKAERAESATPMFREQLRAELFYGYVRTPVRGPRH